MLYHIVFTFYHDHFSATIDMHSGVIRGSFNH